MYAFFKGTIADTEEDSVEEAKQLKQRKKIFSNFFKVLRFFDEL